MNLLSRQENIYTEGTLYRISVFLNSRLRITYSIADIIRIKGREAFAAMPIEEAVGNGIAPFREVPVV